MCIVDDRSGLYYCVCVVFFYIPLHAARKAAAAVVGFYRYKLVLPPTVSHPAATQGSLLLCVGPLPVTFAHKGLSINSHSQERLIDIRCAMNHTRALDMAGLTSSWVNRRCDYP